jgi:putative ABC transport system ATP-binding protein
MTSYQNIRYPTLIKFFPGNVDREIREMAAFLNIENVLHQKPMTLSGGERQRVAIARAIINHPRLILADEPTGNLDVVTAAEIKNLFLNLKNSEKMAIILVTHDQTLIEIADEHYHLENGKLQNVTGQKSVKRNEQTAKAAKRAAVKASETQKKDAGVKKTSKKSDAKPAAKSKKVK